MEPAIIAAIIGAIATIVGAVIAALVSQRKKDKTKLLPTQGSRHLTVGAISGGAVIQAEKIEGIKIEEAASKEKLDKGEVSLQFVTEGIKGSPRGFQVLFSIWNNSSNYVKLYEFFTKEYIRVPSTMYHGGQRSVLQLIQNETSLWKGETYELPPDESASFDLQYTIKTGSANGDPWIIFGIFARYHSPIVAKQVLHSDALYLFSHYGVEVVTLENVEELNGPNMWKHHIYALLLESFSEHLKSDRDKLIQLMKNDYLRGVEVLEKALTTKAVESERHKVAVLKKRLFTLLEEEEKLAPLGKESQKVKDELLEELRQIADKYCGMAFMHVCQPSGTVKGNADIG